MLTLEEIRAHLATRVYRPGWELTVREGAWEGHHLTVTAKVENAYRPGEMTALDVHCTLPPIPDVAYLDVWVMARIARLEVHEAREFFRDAETGRPVFDPHGPDADQDRW